MKIVPLTWLLHVALDIFQSGMHKLHALKLKKVASDLQYGAFHSPMTVLCLKLNEIPLKQSEKILPMKCGYSWI